MPEWFAHTCEDASESPEFRERRERIRKHSDMPKVIKKLLTLSNPEERGEDVRAFLAFSLALPDYWEFRKATPKNFAYADTENLAREAGAFRSALQRHSDLVLFYFGEARDGKRPSFAKVKRRSELLLSAVTHIHERAVARTHFLSNEDIPAPPKLPGHPRAREQFCMRALAMKAEELWGAREPIGIEEVLQERGLVRDKKTVAAARNAGIRANRQYLATGGGLHTVIALLVSTSLDLDVPLSPEQVKQFLRHNVASRDRI